MISLTEKRVVLEYVDEISEMLTRYPNNQQRIKVRVAFLREFVENINSKEEHKLFSQNVFKTDFDIGNRFTNDS